SRRTAPELQIRVKRAFPWEKGRLQWSSSSGGSYRLHGRPTIWCVRNPLQPRAWRMGEVYRERDPRLNRNVAIKILASAFARAADRLARFKREAKVLASLNHPNARGWPPEPTSVQACFSVFFEIVEGFKPPGVDGSRTPEDCKAHHAHAHA